MREERITVRWAGATRLVTVLQRYKNGKIKVLVQSGRWAGGRAGTTSSDTITTVEPWQVVDTTREETQ